MFPKMIKYMILEIFLIFLCHVHACGSPKIFIFALTCPTGVLGNTRDGVADLNMFWFEVKMDNDSLLWFYVRYHVCVCLLSVTACDTLFTINICYGNGTQK